MVIFGTIKLNNVRSTLLVLLIACGSCSFSQGNRNYSGIGNNLDSVYWGSAGYHFSNNVSNGFGDLVSTPGGQERPNPREISNALGSQVTFMANELGLSDMVWGWGQFIDHDINFNDDNFFEPLDIAVPPCDPQFDPNCTGNEFIPMFRSLSDPATGNQSGNPRRHINEISSFIDASAVYGTDSLRVAWLRTFVEGKLKTSSGGLPPWNTVDGEYTSAIDPTAPFMATGGPVPPTKYFVCGDIRANEQPGLSAFHTLWVREHNRLCDELALANPGWNDEELFQRARKLVGALLQVITYQEFLPAMGVNLPAYPGYNNQLDPSVMNVFSASAYRFGHSCINGTLMRYDEDGSSWSFGAVDLRDAFFAPHILKDEGGIEPFLRGMAAQEHQLVDPLMMDDMRNMLFGQPGSGGLDLMALNIQRGRERGLPDHNTLRQDLQLLPHPDLTDLTSDVDLRYKLSTVYASVDSLDSFIGLLSEDHLPGSLFGETLYAIMAMQFQKIRDGDRFYYENDQEITSSEITQLQSTTLADVILRNSSIQNIHPNVFLAQPIGSMAVEYLPFSNISNIALRAFPNPVQRYFSLQLEARHSSTASLEIFDLNGALISTEQVRIERGKNTLEFELQPGLANGHYSIVLRSEEGIGQLKIVKQE